MQKIMASIDTLQFFSLPGYGNSGPGHWQTWMEGRLQDCTRIEQHSWEKPDNTLWIQTIQSTIGDTDPSKVFIIAHSLGCIAVAHWAKKYKLTIAGALLVGPPDIENPYTNLGLESFLPIPDTSLPFPSLVIGSTNDHWASVSRVEEFAKSWGSQLYFEENAGHINTDAGFGPWENGLHLLRNFINTL